LISIYKIISGISTFFSNKTIHNKIYAFIKKLNRSNISFKKSMMVVVADLTFSCKEIINNGKAVIWIVKERKHAVLLEQLQQRF
jgi:hypothetical protein